MAVRDPILRVTMGPYLSLRLCKICSMSESECLSHRMLPRIGREVGPGGRWGLVGLRNERRGLSRADTQMVMTRINQASMVVISIKIFFFICDVCVCVCLYI